MLVGCVLFVVGFAVYRVDRRPLPRHPPGTRRRRRYDAAEPLHVLAAAGSTVPLGERATLLQFSSAFCAPCRATRRVLGEVADLVPGVTHVEVDAEHHLEVVRALRRAAHARPR